MANGTKCDALIIGQLGSILRNVKSLPDSPSVAEATLPGDNPTQ
jgi:hypothetical protein